MAQETRSGTAHKLQVIDPPEATVPPEVVARWEAEGLVSNKTLAQAFADSARDFPDALLTIYSETRPHQATIEQFYRDAMSVAAGMQSFGIGPGDPVGIQLPGWYEAVLMQAATALTGGVIVPLVHTFGTSEISFIMAQTGMKLAVTPGQWIGKDLSLPMAECIGGKAIHHYAVCETAAPGAMPFSELMHPPENYRAPEGVRPDDIALIIFTSGTTSAPKGACHSSRTILSEMNMTVKLGGRTGISPWPPGHIAGTMSLMRFWSNGMTTVVMEKWDATAGARLIEQYKVESMSTVPLHLTTLMDAAERDGRDLSSLTHLLCGATTVPAALVERAASFGLRTFRCYGMSEHPTITQGDPSDPLELRLNTDGTLNPGVELRFVDDEGKDVPVGTDGEILSRGPDRMLGYLDPELNKDAFVAGGWLRTGDIGRIDADGNVAITDRKKDVIIRGGETLSSREIEEHVAAIPQVREVAAVGYPDEMLGEKVCICVTLAEGATLDLAEIDAHFRARGVARMKTPEKLAVFADFPRTGSGKIQKAQLRQIIREQMSTAID